VFYPFARLQAAVEALAKPRILVVDDERVVVEVLGSLLDDPDREILTADCSARALEHARTGEIAVALVDKNLGADSGLTLARQLKQVQPEIEIILITGYASVESAIEAVQIGAFDYLTKPIADFSALSFKVQSALEKSQLRRAQRLLTERLMDYEVRHRRLIDAAPEAIVLYDSVDGRVVEANEAAVKLYGFSPQELLHARAAELRGGAPEGAPGPVPVLQRHRRKDGSAFTAEVTFTEFQQQGRTLRVQSARDVSEREERRRDLEERLLATQRMDAIGRLAGGVAHDFSNLLAVISAHADYAVGALDAAHPLRPEIEGILRASERGAALTRQLQLFSRRIALDGAGVGMSGEVLRSLSEPFARAGSQPTLDLPASAVPPRGNGERVLLVEDEEPLRLMVRRMLTSNGYEVLDAPDGEQGLRAAEGRPLDLLLTDVTMPHLDGPSLALRLLAIRPSLRILYMSGDCSGDGHRGPPAPLLQKPFTPNDLLGVVRRILDA
jgi:PAS domain S-box-containing protein